MFIRLTCECRHFVYVLSPSLREPCWLAHHRQSTRNSCHEHPRCRHADSCKVALISRQFPLLRPTPYLLYSFEVIVNGFTVARMMLMWDTASLLRSQHTFQYYVLECADWALFSQALRASLVSHSDKKFSPFVQDRMLFET